jgi:hypothetical protein
VFFGLRGRGPFRYVTAQMGSDGGSGGWIDKFDSPAPDHPFQARGVAAAQDGFARENTVGGADGLWSVVGRQDFQGQLANQALGIDFAVFRGHTAKLGHTPPADHDDARVGGFGSGGLPESLIEDFFAERVAIVGGGTLADAGAAGGCAEPWYRAKCRA